jgi:uncharacterized protein
LKLDLTDAEFDELDALLADTPAPLQAMDLPMVDGYLCGVIVQPQAIPAESWLPGIFDVQARPLPAATDARWLARVRALLLRRHEALARALEEDGAFDPVLPAADVEPDDPALRDALRELPAFSRSLFPWALGFQSACARFPALAQSGEPAIDAALARVFRHAPPATKLAREARQLLDRSAPLASEEAAIDDLVTAVAELWELTNAQRLRVETVRRTEPKVGRNEPCPCGSGRKYKHCHGA